MDYEKAAAQQRNSSFGASIGASGASLAKTLRDTPLMDVECEHLSQSIAELHASVAELLAQIAPVCQPSGLEQCHAAEGSAVKQLEATPSAIRGRLMSMRFRVEYISHLIAPVKYRIEL